jgi:hypothetical protein
VHAAFLAVTLAAGCALFGEVPNAPPDVPEETLAFPTPVVSATAPMDLRTPTVSKRLFGVIPNYRADQLQAQYTPLSTAGKFAIARSDSFDWPNYFLLAGYALQAQVAAGGFTHSGGLNGFGRFYSRSVADQIIGSYVTEAILPALFHQDPRFFRLGKGTLWYRVYNASTRVVVTKKDDGSATFNISEIIGNMGVTALGTLYYPDSRTVSEGVERYGMALGNDMISNLLTEFWPDIRRRLPFHRRG